MQSTLIGSCSQLACSVHCLDAPWADTMEGWSMLNWSVHAIEGCPANLSTSIKRGVVCSAQHQQGLGRMESPRCTSWSEVGSCLHIFHLAHCCGCSWPWPPQAAYDVWRCLGLKGYVIRLMAPEFSILELLSPFMSIDWLSPGPDVAHGEPVSHSEGLTPCMAGESWRKTLGAFGWHTCMRVQLGR